MRTYTFCSSNGGKIAQIQDMASHIPGLIIAHARNEDESEIDGPAHLVPAYKARNLPVGYFVDDTQLAVSTRPEWNPINIKWNEETLLSCPECIGARIEETIWLALRTPSHVELYRGTQTGRWIGRQYPDGFGYNTGFAPDGQPDGQQDTLEGIIRQGRLLEYSSRFEALKALHAGNYTMRIALDTLPPWTGAWQTA